MAVSFIALIGYLKHNDYIYSSSEKMKALELIQNANKDF